MCGDPMRGAYAVPLALAVRFWRWGEEGDLGRAGLTIWEEGAGTNSFGGAPTASAPSRRDRSRLLAARRGTDSHVSRPL